MNKIYLILAGTVILLVSAAGSIFYSLVPTCEEQIESYRSARNSPVQANLPKFAALSSCSKDTQDRY